MSVIELTYFVCRTFETGNFADKAPVSFLHTRYGMHQKSIELLRGNSVSGSSWSKALNSFRVISFVIFTAVFLTTVTFSSQAERDPWVKARSLGQSHLVPTSVVGPNEFGQR